MRAIVLGALRVERDGHEISLEAPKDRAVLSLLALRAPDPVADDELIDAAWGPDAGAEMYPMLASSLERLRATLGEDRVVREPGGGHRLAVEPSDIDVNQFVSAIAVAAADRPDRAQWLTSALALWRGPPLPDLADGSRAQQEAAALEQQRLDTEEELVEALLDEGHVDEAIAHLEHQVHAQPLRLRRWALTIVALVQAGRVADARHAERRAGDILSAEAYRELGAAIDDRGIRGQLREQADADPGSAATVLRTFVFTDIEGSTIKWEHHPEVMGTALELHDRLVREICARHGGECFTHLGDGFGLAFVRPTDALSASTEIQETIARTDWPPETPLRVRIGIHFGMAARRDGNYFGPPVNACARINSIAHGGQSLVSAATVELIGAAASTTPVGSYRLRGVEGPVAVHQVGGGDFPPPRGTDPTRTNLPVANAPIVGRADAVHAVRRQLTNAPVVTIVGAGGSGKTRLAVEVAHEELLTRKAGAYFVELAGVRDPLDVPAAVAGSLRLSIGPDGPLAALLDHVRSNDVLVVIDNCEHLLDAVADLAETFSRVDGDARVLATSIQALGVDGERVHVLEPLDAGGIHSPAVQLLVDCARRTSPAFELRPDDESLAIDICRRLDGLPLAIELAASRLGLLSLEDLGTHLDDRFGVLRGGRRRARTMEETVAWSYDLLEADEQRSFRFLGVFAGAFDLAAAAAILGTDELDALDRLDGLVAKSLVLVDHSAHRHRFRLLETLRAYARLRSAEHDEVDAARDRHLALHVDAYVPEDGTVLIPSRDVVTARRVHSDLVAAYDHATTTERWADAARLSFLLTSVSAMTSTGVPTGLEATSGRFDADHPIGGMLVVAKLLRAVAVDDWNTAIATAQEATQSSLPAVAGTGCWLLGFTSAMVDGPATEPMLAHAARHLAEIEPGSHNARSVSAGITYTRAAPAAMRGDVEAARAACRAWYEAGPYAELVATEPHLLAELAVVEIIDGRVIVAADLLDRDDVDEFLQASSVVVKVAALALGGEIDAAITLAVPFSREALLGRVTRMANDALVGLAAILIADGDHDGGRDLLRAARGARAPHIGLLAGHLADRIDSRQAIQADRGDPVFDRADARVDLEAALELPIFR
ncbi:MAG: BTAD domain-containing putative transcriptional regulator [Acidimicrobiales bacterium]